MTRAIRTLMEADRHRFLIRAECVRCRKTADFYPRDLAKAFSWGKEISDLPFKCDLCGDPASSVRPFECISDERTRKRYVWRPVLVKD